MITVILLILACTTTIVYRSYSAANRAVVSQTNTWNLTPAWCLCLINKACIIGRMCPICDSKKSVKPLWIRPCGAHVVVFPVLSGQIVYLLFGNGICLHLHLAANLKRRYDWFSVMENHNSKLAVGSSWVITYFSSGVTHFSSSGSAVSTLYTVMEAQCVCVHVW